MASSDAVVAPSSFDSLRMRRSAQFVDGCVLRFWDSKNVKKQGEFMGITLLMLDSKTVIHGFIPAARSPYYSPLLKAGSVVRVARFEVAKCANMYKITEHPFMIRFIPQTTIDEVTEDVPVISFEKFMLQKYDPLQALANTNLELPGNPNIHAIAKFTTSLTGTESQALPSLHPATMITNKQLTSIEDLNKFLSNSTAEEAYFVCKARIVKVLSKNGWYYVSCNRCGQELDTSAASLPCNQCVHPNAIGVPKFRVELVVDDGNNYATFVGFNKEMLHLTKQKTASQHHNEVNGDDVNRRGCNKLPHCLAQLRGQDYVYHVRVTPCSFTPSSRTFTVSGFIHKTPAAV